MSWEYNNYLAHFGIFGMKWGVRRYQNKDGSLTPEGKARYQNKDGSLNDEGKKLYQKQLDESIKKNWAKVHNNVAARSGEAYAKINESSKYKGKKIDWDNPGKFELTYLKDIAKANNKLFEEECQKIFGNNPMWDKTQISKLPTAHQYDRMIEDIKESADRKYKEYSGAADGIEYTLNRQKEQYKKNPSERLRRSIEQNEKDLKELRDLAKRTKL